MDGLNKFNTMPPEEWRTQNFRQSVVAKIEEAIHRSGMQVARNSSEMENHVFMKAKNKEEYMNMVAKLLLHVRDLSQKPNQGAPNMQGSNQNQAGPAGQGPQQPGQPSQGPNPQGNLQPDPINALQNLTQGSRNQMMNMGPQGQMTQQVVMGNNPGMGGMQGQMGQQGSIVSQGPQAQAASNLLQTLNQRPQLNMTMQNKLEGGMGMVPNQGQMGNNMLGGMGGMNPMNSQLQNQLAGQGMQGQMMPNMSMQGGMQVPMGNANNMVGQMPCNQGMGNMNTQMGPNMQNQIAAQMVGGMNNSQLVNMMGMRGVGGVGGGGQAAFRGGGAAGYLRQSPSPSAPSPLQGPSPNMNVMGGALASPLGVAQPSPSAPMHHHHQQQPNRGVNIGMVASPSSSLNTPVGANVASPSGEEAAYREKVRQLSKYIEPLRRMVHRMVSEGENVEKLTKMKNLLDILSNPNKRMPLETLIKCEVVLEKLDFKRSEGLAIGLPPTGKEQIFNPLLEVVNNCLQSPSSNYTLKRTFGHALEALNGTELRNMPPPLKVQKTDEPPMEIPDVLQGEIARLDSRFKVSLEPNQLSGGCGGIALVAQLDGFRLPCVPRFRLLVPRDYPLHPPRRIASEAPPAHHQPRFLQALDKAMDARCARLPKSCSVGQLLDAWEMSVRQACAPSPVTYAPVPALGL